jgi:cytochrome b involved in lipid metabolism
MTQKITDKDLRDHCTEKSAWIAIRGKVYDVTNFFAQHPGGKDALRLGDDTFNSTLDNTKLISPFFTHTK